MDVIKTWYQGIAYRSRTEARWAVLLDCLGVKHIYEAEGVCKGGFQYLPDFYLPGADMFIEVKPHPDGADFQRLSTFWYSGMKILVVGDIPENFTAPRGKGKHDWVLYSDFFLQGTKLTRILALDGEGHCKLMSDVDALSHADVRRTLYCYSAARNAKFEHGEKPYLPPASKGAA